MYGNKFPIFIFGEARTLGAIAFTEIYAKQMLPILLSM